MFFTALLLFPMNRQNRGGLREGGGGHIKELLQCPELRALLHDVAPLFGLPLDLQSGSFPLKGQLLGSCRRDCVLKILLLSLRANLHFRNAFVFCFVC